MTLGWKWSSPDYPLGGLPMDNREAGTYSLARLPSLDEKSFIFCVRKPLMRRRTGGERPKKNRFPKMKND